MKNQRKKALGRGLDALFPEVEKAVLEESEKLVSLPVDSIQFNPFQPRRRFNKQKLSKMADSIRNQGLLQPIIVRPVKKGYQLVAGERRLRATRLAGLTEIPSLILNIDDEKTLELALVENLQRENLNPIEEARGYNKLITQFNLTQEEISGRVGKDRSTVANSLRLLKLPAEIQEEIEIGKLTAGHARALLSLDNPALQTKLCSLIVRKALSVRQAESIAGKWKKQKQGKSVQVHKTPNIIEIEEQMMSILGTRVYVKPSSKTSGNIIIHYSTLEDVDRILEKLGLAVG